MFESLVEPAITDFYELYRTLEKEYFDDTETTDENCGWETRSEVVRMMECIYDHYDEFRLLVMRSEGTKYEDFKHKIATLEEEITLRYLDVLKGKGCKVNGFDRTEFHF